MLNVGGFYRVWTRDPDSQLDAEVCIMSEENGSIQHSQWCLSTFMITIALEHSINTTLVGSYQTRSPLKSDMFHQNSNKVMDAFLACATCSLIRFHALQSTQCGPLGTIMPWRKCRNMQDWADSWLVSYFGMQVCSAVCHWNGHSSIPTALCYNSLQLYATPLTIIIVLILILAYYGPWDSGLHNRYLVYINPVLMTHSLSYFLYSAIGSQESTSLFTSTLSIHHK